MKEERTAFERLFVRLFWTGILLAVVFVPVLMFSVAAGLFGQLPSFEELENPKSSLATEIYCSNGKLLGKYFAENRTNVHYKDLSPHLVTALVSTEDERFYSHSGIDFKGLMRALFFMGSKGGASTITQQLSKMLFSEKPHSKLERIKQKLQEYIIAVRLERRYTKEEILTMYFNKLDFVNNAVGIKSASNVYFNKEPNDLLPEEAAMLVGMAKNPSLFNPVKRPDMTRDRRNVVFNQMLRNKAITETLYDSLCRLPLKLDYHVVDHKEGLAAHFREVLRLELKELFMEKDENGEYKYLNKETGKPYDIYKDGLKIYTTIDSRMQQYAEWAVKTHLGKELQKEFFKTIKKQKNAPFDWRVSKEEIQQILETAMSRSDRYRILAGKQCASCGRRGKYIEKTVVEGKEVYHCTADDCGFDSPVYSNTQINKIFNTPVPMKVFSWSGEIDTVLSPYDSIRYYKSFLQAGLMSMDPHSGHVKAWVGGINSKHFAFDHVKQARRQVGSTFKPIVYTLAIQNGYSPCKEFPNVLTTFKQGEFGLPEDWTPQNSDGIYGCNVSLKYGLANSMNTITARIMKEFGPQAVVKLAKDMGIQSPLEAVPALCLGVADLNVYEMTGANATFANKGVWIEPTYLLRIEDKYGNVIKNFVPQSKEAMNEETAYIMLEMMKGVVDGVCNKCMGEKSGYTCIGTGVRIRATNSKTRPYSGFRSPIAGKTGTTQNNSDGWFMGITPDLVTGVWVGAEDRSVRFSNTYFGQGANTALPIWGYYMQKVQADSSLKISTGDFQKPVKPLSIEYDCAKYKEGPDAGKINFDEE